MWNYQRQSFHQLTWVPVVHPVGLYLHLQHQAGHVSPELTREIEKEADRKEKVDESNTVEKTNTPSEFSKAVEEADLVADISCVSPTGNGGGLLKQLDVGMVMSISGTPSKIVQPSTSYVNSPVLAELLRTKSEEPRLYC